MIPILRKWVKSATQKELLYFLIIWAFTMLISVPSVGEYFPVVEIRNFGGYIGYVVLGCYLNRLDLNSYKWPVVLALGGWLFTLVGTFVISKQNNDFSHALYEYLTLNVCVQAIGVFLLFKLMEIRNVLLNEIITFFSAYSFGVYLCHVMVMEYLGVLGIDAWFTHPVISITLTSMSVLVISGLFIYVLRKIKVGAMITG